MLAAKCLWLRICSFASFLVFSAAASAGPAFLISNTAGDLLLNPPFTLGFQFSTNSAITVTSLGVFDSDQDGLNEQHPIGLWDDAGTLLASAIVPDGSSGMLVNQFRYVSIAPILLNSGGVYRIGALDNGVDPLIGPGAATDFVTDMAISFLGNSFIMGGTLTDPPLGGTNPAFFGPNFLFRTAAVPAPGVLGLLGTGLLGFGFILHKQRRMK